jgi:hypothetical protein
VNIEDISAWERARSIYYLREIGGDSSSRWRQVTEDEFIAAERRAGFIPQAGCGPIATAGFGDGKVEGKIEYVDASAGKASDDAH